MHAKLISEQGAYKAKAAAFVKALKHQWASQDEELANAIATKDLEISSIKEQIAHQIGLETQVGIPKSSLTPIPSITTQIFPTKTRFNPGRKTTIYWPNTMLIQRNIHRILNTRIRS